MKKICSFLRNLLSKAKKYTAKYIRPSIEVVQLIKEALDSPAVPFLTTIIPGKWDDVTVNLLRIYLPEVLKVLGYAEECSKATTNDALIQCVIAKLRLLKPDGQDAAFRNIAVLLSKYMADGKLSTRELIHLVEETYHSEFK